MNFQYWPLLDPIKIMMVNSLVPASQMAVIKLLEGSVFGMNQLIDIILLVYSNEIPTAEGFIQEVIGCNFRCLNSIVATSDLPRITDADIFCLMTNFPNPNLLDFNNLDTDDQFDTFYLMIKVALSLGKSATEEDKLALDGSTSVEKKPKPLIIGDGLVVLDLVRTMGQKNMASGYYCAGRIAAIVKSVFSDYLKVQCDQINTPYVWGASDVEFHVEIERPIVKHDKITKASHCEWEMVSEELLRPLKLDHTQFTSSWMKKELIEKLRHLSIKNPSGAIDKAWKMKKMLSLLWTSRLSGIKCYVNLGTISDGSLQTLKGLPYVLPLVIRGDGTAVINNRYADTAHVKLEIKRFNKIVKLNHEKLVNYCHKFLEENIINRAFVAADDESGSEFSSSAVQSSQHEYWPLLDPIKIMMVNSLVPASQMAVIKLLEGSVFGMNQLIDIILLVYSNEIPTAEGFIQEVIACNFRCLNSIVATSDLPRITDADIFCLMTNFPNPNLLDFNNLDTDDQFDTFYLMIKVALSLGKSAAEEDKLALDESTSVEKKPKPLIIGDGLVVLDLVRMMGHKNMASGYYCAGRIAAIVKSVLSDYLKVPCDQINTPYIWGASDVEFHVEIERPIVKHDKITKASHCGWDIVSEELLRPLKLDHTQFNSSWLKKELIQKLRHLSVKNPSGAIDKAWKMKRILFLMWGARLSGINCNLNLGTISDGSLCTLKGLPYVLPAVFRGDGTSVIDHRYADTAHVRQEIKRINKIVKQNHDKLVNYCHKFLEENIINRAFVAADDESESQFSSSADQSSQHGV